jgi:hypothetical protein
MRHAKPISTLFLGVCILLILLVHVGAGAAPFPAQGKPGAAPSGRPKTDPAQKGGSKKKDEAGKSDAKPDEDDAKPAPGSGETAPKPPSGPDVDYVKEHLKEFVHGTIAFGQDGTVTIEYDFHEKKEEHQNDFAPPISPQNQKTFRWSIYQEEHVIGGDTGLRISDAGAAVLDVWFTDSVEASAEFLQGISWSKRQYLAVVFQAKNGKAIGNNYGGQCANFSGAVYHGGTPANTEVTSFNSRVKIGLRVKDGKFDATREGRPRTSAKYTVRSFSSGRVGFVWGGAVAGTLCGFTVKGMIDYPLMAKEMKKRAGRGA